MPDGGLFICIQSNALDHIAKIIFPYSYEIERYPSIYVFSKTPIEEKQKALVEVPESFPQAD